MFLEKGLWIGFRTTQNIHVGPGTTTSDKALAIED